MVIRRAGLIAALGVVTLTLGGAVYGLTHMSSLCRTSEPASWRAAARAHPRYEWTVPAVSAQLGAGPQFAAFADGTLVVDRSAAGGQHLVTVSRSGAAAPLWTVPPHQSVDTLQARGGWVVVTYVDTRTSTSPSISYTATVAVDAHTGATTVIAGGPAAVTGLRAGFGVRARTSFGVDRAGRVWYVAGPAPRPTLYSYDLATGRRVPVGRAPAGHRTAPQLAVGVDGVYWNYLDRFGTSVTQSVRAASLPVPAPVATHHRHSTDDDLATDGRSYAWTSGRTLSWWQPGMRAPKLVDLADADDGTTRVDLVAGPLVSAFSGPEDHWRTVLDLRTSAYVINPSFTDGADPAVTPDHVYTRADHSEGRATLYDVPAALPRLHC